MSDNSSSSSRGRGNSSSPPPKQIAPAIRWCFTLNNWTQEEYDEISSKVPIFCKYAIIGSEIGPECGTPHLQGYIEFKTKKRPLSVFACHRIYWTKCSKLGTKEKNDDYCGKDKELLLLYPEPRIKKCLSESSLNNWEREILSQIKEEPDDRTIHWYWSKNGGIGKTTFCKYLVLKEDFIVLGGKASDCKNGVIEYAKKHQGDCPKRIVINIPRSFCQEYVSYEAFENIKDMIFYSGKYEGGMICDDCPHLYIFANFAPDREKLSEDRWLVTEL